MMGIYVWQDMCTFQNKHSKTKYVMTTLIYAAGRQHNNAEAIHAWTQRKNDFHLS